MLDIKLIRDNPEEVKKRLATVGVPGTDVDALLNSDRVRRARISEVETLRAERTSRSKDIRKIADLTERDTAVRSMRALGERVSQLEKQLAREEEDFQQRLLELPNLPHPDVPVGQDEDENVVIRTEGKLPALAFPPRPHWELGEALGIIDFERGVKFRAVAFISSKGWAPASSAR